MKLGAEPKKVGIFVALLAVAGIVYWMNSSSEAPPAAAVTHPAADAVASVAVVPAVPDGAGNPAKKRTAQGRASIVENIYKLVPVDPTRIDPTLRLDLLTKVQSVELEGGVRNLFQFSEAPPPPVVAAKGPIPNVGPIHPNAQPSPPAASMPKPAVPTGPPPPPPINLKYYGYSTKRSDGEKKAFFLDGEDVIVASEGEIIKKQYKVVRIGVNSVQMEDTTSKTTQTLPIQQDAAPV